MMPYTCSLEQGRLKLTPSAGRTYSILGQREERAYTYCAPGRPQDCEAWRIHRFSISCAGKAVSWLRVVSALENASIGHTWREQGQLNIVRAAAPSIGDAKPCAGHDARQRYAKSRQPGAGCLPWQPKADRERLVLPVGFAPVGEVRARILFPAPPAAAVAAGPEADRRELAAHLRAFAEAAAAAVEQHAVEVAAASPAGTHAQTWPAVIETGSTSPASTGPMEQWAATGPLSITYFAALLLLLTPLLIAREKLAPVRARVRNAWQRVRPGSGANPLHAIPPTGDRIFDNAVRHAASSHALAAAALEGLRPGMPLRDVLETELHVAAERLAEARTKAAAEIAAGSSRGDRFPAQLRALMREFERIQRIAESAAHSMDALPGPLRMPATRGEAYQVLGVNAGVSEGNLKKIVDALRMTWHPDLARDDRDRALREDRIKQINIAWELINPKRQAA